MFDVFLFRGLIWTGYVAHAQFPISPFKGGALQLNLFPLKAMTEEVNYCGYSKRMDALY